MTFRNRLVLQYPASWWGARWRDALPTGNGTIGAAVYGGVHDETVLLTHEDLWNGAMTPELPDVSDRLPRVRQLLADGKVREADRLLADDLNRLGYNPRMGSPLPLGDLKIRMPVHRGFREYRRMLNMETGEISVAWKDGEASFLRRLFVSRSDDLVVMEISGMGGGVNAILSLGLHDLNDRRAFSGAGVDLPGQVEVECDDGGMVRYAARNDDGMDFGAVARVFPIAMPSSPTPPALRVEGDGLVVENAARVLVLMKLFVQGRRETAWRDLLRQLGNVEMDYEALLQPHAVEHGELFSRVKLDLGGSEQDHVRTNEDLLLEAYQGEAPSALVEKLWAYGRYLLICSSRPGGQPCPLYGKWCGDYQGMWTFHMVNENLQMIYWQALPGMLGETVLPVFDYFDRLMDDFRENARKLYGCRGIYIPAPTTPESGLLKCLSPHIIHWTGGAAWVAQLYYDYYLYTGDENFLRNRALPFLRETALFYEDFFTVDKDGSYVSSPSMSPENTPANYWDGKGAGAVMETTINATMDFALAKEVLTHLLEMAQVLDLDAADVAKWTGMLERIPPYQINEDGAVREWMHPGFSDNYHHRHQSHIYPVFPGAEVTRHSDPGLFKAFEVAIRKRLVIGISEQTGWSLAHMAHVYARMNEGDSALECLDLLARSSVTNNLFTTHNDWRQMGIGVDMSWAPFQIDANMGWTSAVQEMLLFSVPGRISILPALPARWEQGAVAGLMARGGVAVSISWNLNRGKLVVELVARSMAQMVEVELPWGRDSRLTIALEPGQVQRIVNGELTSAEPGVAPLHG